MLSLSSSLQQRFQQQKGRQERVERRSLNHKRPTFGLFACASVSRQDVKKEKKILIFSGKKRLGKLSAGTGQTKERHHQQLLRYSTTTSVQVQ